MMKVLPPRSSVALTFITGIEGILSRSLELAAVRRCSSVRDLVLGFRPALKQRASAIERDQPLHFSAAGIEIVLEHLNRRVDLLVGTTIATEPVRPGREANAMSVVTDMEFSEDTGHCHLPLRIRTTRLADNASYREGGPVIS